MAPRADNFSQCEPRSSEHPAAKPYRIQLVWRNIFLFALLHMASVYGLYLLIFQASWCTWIWTVFLYIFGAFGVTAGAHRLWSHRSYKATTPLKILLLVANTVAFQNDVIEWSRDHRVHHKFSETDADPHNAKRGMFFAHIGWLLVRKHPDVITNGRKFDYSDLTSDPLLRFQQRYYKVLALLGCFVLPSVVPLAWGETLLVAYFTAALFRYCACLHATWTINSIAHMYGNRPYDVQINPRENILSAITAIGEGWHNYHHTFPSDYRAAEHPWLFNLTTVVIDILAWFGLVSDRKTTSHEMIMRKRQRHGDLPAALHAERNSNSVPGDGQNNSM